MRVTFLPDGVTVDAAPGEALSAVAERAGVEIVYSCRVGECATCEVQLVPPADAPPGRAAHWVRACVTRVPRDRRAVTFDVLGDGLPGW